MYMCVYTPHPPTPTKEEPMALKVQSYTLLSKGILILFSRARFREIRGLLSSRARAEEAGLR